MPTVPSTPTATDALLARKEILEGNAVLLHERDTLSQEVAMWEHVLAVIREEVKATGALPELTRLQDAAMVSELGPRRKKAQQELDQQESRIGANQHLITAQTAKIEAQRQQMTANDRQITVLRDKRQTHEEATRVARETHATTSNELQTALMAHMVKMDEAKKALQSTENEEQELRRMRATEEMRLGTKGRDLAIYEARIREAAAKLNPPMDIII